MTLARTLYYASFVVIAATVVLSGAHMWREARSRAGQEAAVAVAIAPSGWVALGADRQTVTAMRSQDGAPRPAWSARLPTRAERLEVTQALVVAVAPQALTVLDLASGAAVFDWALPADERWGPIPPARLGACLVVVSVRDGDARVRCIDPARGAPRWSTTIAGGRDCAGAATAVAGAYLVQCDGWTSIIDATNGAATVDAGGRGLVQLEPPILLRASPVLATAPWFEAEHRFARDGVPVRGLTNFIGQSAVRYADRLLIRAASASEQIALVSPDAGQAFAISAQDLHLADDAPFVVSCGRAMAPRFQLVRLAPRLTAPYDADRAQQRAYGLVDAKQGALAWTSRAYRPLPGAPAGTQPICVAGHYVVPLTVQLADGDLLVALWLLDAETGQTLAVLGSDPGRGPSLVDVTAAQVDADRIVAIGPAGVDVLRWREGEPTLHDAREELERVLGRLP